MIGTHLLDVVEEICLKTNTRQKREEDTDRLLLPPLLFSFSQEKQKIQEVKTFTQEKKNAFEVVSSSNIPLIIMEDIKEQDYLHRLQKFRVLCSLLGWWIRHLLYIRIMWCNNQRTRVLNRIRKPGPLKGLLMRCLVCFLRSYVLNWPRKILLQSHYQE